MISDVRTVSGWASFLFARWPRRQGDRRARCHGSGGVRRRNKADKVFRWQFASKDDPADLATSLRSQPSAIHPPSGPGRTDEQRQVCAAVGQRV